jgi:uncharacterized membrane protein
VVDGMPIPAIALASIAAGVMGLVHLGAFELPIADLQAAAIPMDPFPATGATSAAVLAIAAVAAGRIRGWPIALQASVLAAGGIVVYAVPFLIDRWAVAEAWAGLAIGAVATQRVPALRSFLFRLTAYGLALLATLVALSVAPPARLAVQEAGVDPAVMLQSILALGSCLIAGVALAATERDRRVAIGLWIAVGVGLVYAASVAVVDLVGFVTMDQMAIDERRTLGQTALTLLWAVLGIVGFVVGLARRVPLLRQAGLALLAITTVKVFVFDLAALDVAYRVISLVGLGIILLAGAWLWQRAQGAPGGDAA